MTSARCQERCQERCGVWWPRPEMGEMLRKKHQKSGQLGKPADISHTCGNDIGNPSTSWHLLLQFQVIQIYQVYHQIQQNHWHDYLMTKNWIRQPQISFAWLHHMLHILTSYWHHIDIILTSYWHMDKSIKSHVPNSYPSSNIRKERIGKDCGILNDPLHLSEASAVAGWIKGCDGWRFHK